MGSILDVLAEIAAERSKAIPDEEFLLRGLWCVDYRCRPTPQERFMAYSFLIAQTTHQGCCYADFGTVTVDAGTDSMLGLDARTLPASTLTERIAFLDAVYGTLSGSPDESHTLTGMPSEKAQHRAELVVAEVLKELDRSVYRRVTNIGVMGNFIQQLQRYEVDLTASDFDEELVGCDLNGVRILHGSRSLELVADSDVALVCGESLATETLDDIVKVAQDNSTTLVIFAVSGCHFAEEYVRTFGVDVVISEPQPQYLFQGTSYIRVYRRHQHLL